jgi:hypothetical protein
VNRVRAAPELALSPDLRSAGAVDWLLSQANLEGMHVAQVITPASSHQSCPDGCPSAERALQTLRGCGRRYQLSLRMKGIESLSGYYNTMAKNPDHACASRLDLLLSVYRLLATKRC